MLAPHVTGGSVSYIEQQFVTERQNGSMLVIERIRVDRAFRRLHSKWTLL